MKAELIERETCPRCEGDGLEPGWTLATKERVDCDACNGRGWNYINQDYVDKVAAAMERKEQG